jgi:lipocalin
MRLMSLVIVMFSLLAGFASVTPSRAAERPLETVASVDLNRDLGRWYEAAHDPARLNRTLQSASGDAE